MHQDIAHILLTKEQIQSRIQELGRELMRDYAGKEPVFVGVLKGVVVFYADMIRAFDDHCQLDFMWISSYKGTESSGNICVKQDVKSDLTGRHVVILEDILDTGRSLQFVAQHLKDKGAASVRICTLLDKPEGRAPGVDIRADYVGAHIEVPAEKRLTTRWTEYNQPDGVYAVPRVKQ